MRAIDEQATLQGGGDERRAFHGKFDAENESFAADLAYEIEFTCQGFEAVAKFGATIADVRK